MTAGPVILCLNSGSSSLKFALYHFAEAAETLLADGAVERIGLPGSRLWVRSGARAPLMDEPGVFPDHYTAVHATFAAPVRWEVCRDLEYLGIRLDAQRNDRHAAISSIPESRCMVRVVPTNEDLMVARQGEAS
jgi:acetate kinase